MALRLCLILTTLLLASCAEPLLFSTEQLITEITLMRSDNFGGNGSGDGQDVGVTVVEHQQAGYHPLEVSFSIGDELNWQGYHFPLPVIADNYRVTYDQKFKPIKVTGQITGGRAHSFRSIVDTMGERYVGAYVKNSVTFLGNTIAFLPITLNQGLFYKEGREGELKWYYKINGTGASGLSQFSLDQNGNSYVVGNFAGVSSLYLNEDVLLNLDNTYNHFLMKLSPAGDLVWIRYFKISQIRDIEVFENKILLSGYFSANLRIEDKVDVNSLGSHDALVALYDVDGNFLWHKQMGGATEDIISCGVLDDKGIYLGGYFSGNPTIDGQTIASSVKTATLLKLNLAGELEWKRSMGVDALGTTIQSNCISLYQDHIYWGTNTDGVSQMEHAPVMNITGKSVLLLQVEKDSGKTIFYDRFTGATTASVFETFVDHLGRLTFGIYWSGSEMTYRGKTVAKNGGGQDAYLGIYLIPN